MICLCLMQFSHVVYFVSLTVSLFLLISFLDDLCLCLIILNVGFDWTDPFLWLLSLFRRIVKQLVFLWFVWNSLRFVLALMERLGAIHSLPTAAIRDSFIFDLPYHILNLVWIHRVAADFLLLIRQGRRRWRRSEDWNILNRLQIRLLNGSLRQCWLILLLLREESLHSVHFLWTLELSVLLFFNVLVHRFLHLFIHL